MKHPIYNVHLILILFAFNSNAQEPISLASSNAIETSSIAALIDSLCFVIELPHCLNAPHEQPDSNSIFWRVVQLKSEAIPFLIEKMDDTTSTKARAKWFGCYYDVADIAHEVLTEIIHDFPTFELLDVPFDTNGCEFCSYWEHLDDYANRKKFKIAIENWYHHNRKNLIWEEFQWSGDFCTYRNPNKVYLVLKK